MAYVRTAGWNKAAVVTPSDTVDLPAPSQALYVGSAGLNITGLLEDGSSLLLTAIPVGAIIPIKFKRIMATGTTATAIVSLWDV